MKTLFYFILACLFSLPLAGQEAATGQPDLRYFIESKWRYTYTLHTESNTIIHKADERYDFYLYFRYDYTYQEYLNGKLSEGNWSLDGRTLFYTFQHINKFEIVELSKNVLSLQFTQRNSKGTYQYHFVRVESKAAPFVRPINELPEVLVEADDPRKKDENRRGWLSFSKRKDKKKKQREEMEASNRKQEHISVELIGGGFYGGIDPVIKDFIQIKTDGRLIKEFQSLNNGLLITKKNISREELEQFADWIVKQKFFDMERVYDCTDPACLQRKGMKPAPIPLRIVVSYGDRKKVVTVAIWGKDDLGSRYVDYPPALDAIIESVQKMANRMEDPVVRK